MRHPQKAVLAGATSVMVTTCFFIVMAAAGPEKVVFPTYQTHVLYDVLDQPSNKEVREAYVNPEALKNVRPGQPLPNGIVITMPTFKALLNDKGELVKDPNGRWSGGAWIGSS